MAVRNLRGAESAEGEADVSDEDKAMQLPPGKTCADCVHVQRCVVFGFSWPSRTRCDFYPSRYVPLGNHPILPPAAAPRET